MPLFFSNRKDATGEVATLLAGLGVRFVPVAAEPDQGQTLVEGTLSRAEAARGANGEVCIVDAVELALTSDGVVLAPSELGRAQGPVGITMVVAYADDASSRAFASRIEGMLISAPRGSGGSSFDAWVVPDGFDRTLAELADGGHAVHMRLRPYAELSDDLRGRTYGGVFEAHITIDAEGEEELARFVAFCHAHHVKPIYIELARGETRFQPMTGSYHHGELAAVREEVIALADAITAAGFGVTRAKIEATGNNRDIPETDAEAQETPDNYFEYHIKVRLPAAADPKPLAALAVGHGAHLSRNARKVRPDGGSDRFVTLRVYDAGKATADARFAALREELGAAGHVLAEPVSEYTVYDTNLLVDDGWLPPKS